MANSAKLDDLELVLLRHEDDEPSNPLEDLRTILSIWTSDQRALVEHKVPGKQASVLQDLGRHSLRFGFIGEFLGSEAKTASETLWRKFNLGKALPFSSDIVSLTSVNKVVIERLDFEQNAGDQSHYRYQMVLREYREPPAKSGAPPKQSEQAAKNTQDETEDAADSVNYITGKVLDDQDAPLEGVSVVIKGDSGEFQTTTDENGVYRKDNLEPGKYKVTIDEPGFEDQEEEVQVGEEENGEEGKGTEEAAGGEEEEGKTGESPSGGGDETAEGSEGSDEEDSGE